jgi:uncharacterized membrane protein
MTKKRILGLDQIRGIGVLLMIIFHLCYDLSMYSLPSFEPGNKIFWYWLPRLIVFIFLFCVGASIRMAHINQFRFKPFLLRFMKIFIAALCISVITYWLYPNRWVYFGTLHCIALCSLCAVPFARFPKFSLMLSIIIIFPVIMFGYKYPWIELAHPSMDYEPFLPWFYACLLGIFVESTKVINKINISPRFGGGLLLLLGQKALIIYLIHQPILSALTYMLHLTQK